MSNPAIHHLRQQIGNLMKSAELFDKRKPYLAITADYKAFTLFSETVPSVDDVMRYLLPGTVIQQIVEIDPRCLTGEQLQAMPVRGY